MDNQFNIYKYGPSEYIYYNVIVHFYKIEMWVFLAILTLLHNLINFKKEITKYFLMHFLVNMYVSISTINDTIFILKHPFVVEPASNFISLAVVMFHIYHIIFYYSKIESDEMIHHFWIVFINLPITWLYYCNIANSSLFFMTGFPGGITYLLLVLKDVGYMSSITEKHISKHLNMWIRIPGAIIVGYIIFVNAIRSDSYVVHISLFLCTAGCFWNGIYFGSTIISSHAILKYSLQKENMSKKVE